MRGYAPLCVVRRDAGGGRWPDRLAPGAGGGPLTAHRARRLRRRRGPGAGGTSSLPALCTSRGTRQRMHAPRPGWVGTHAGCGVSTPHDIGGPRWGPIRPSSACAVCRRRRVVWTRCQCHPVPEGRCPRRRASVSPSPWAPQGLPPKAWEAGRRQAARQAGRTSGWRGGTCGRAPSSAGHPGPVYRRCRPPGRATRPAPGGCRVARTPVRRWRRPPWSWWGARTSQRRSVGILPGRAAHGDRDTRSLAPPGHLAWMWGTQRLYPEPVRRPRAGRQADRGHAEGVVSYPCGP